MPRVMAWVRRVRTASGASAVQIAEYVYGRRRIVAHLGSAHTEAELGLLLQQARGMLLDAGQDEFDLGLEATPRKDRMVAPTAVPALFADPGLAGRPAEQPRVAAPQVTRTSSLLLYEVLAEVYSDLGVRGGRGRDVP